MKAFSDYKVEDRYPARSMYATKEDYVQARTEWIAKDNSVKSELKADILAELGITNHPKADKLYEMAWEAGHSEGYYSVFDRAEELAELIRD